MAELGAAAGRRNQRLGITGRLVYLDGRFIQVLEGPPEGIDAAYDAILRDSRHASVERLLDTHVEDRVFPAWHMDVLAPDARGRVDSVSARDLLWAIDGPGEANVDDIELMTALPTPLMTAPLNATPRQDRSTKTVERLLISARLVGLKIGSPEFTVKDVADHAGVGLKTAYRYFSSPGDMVRMLVRQRMAGLFAGFRAYLNGLTETSDQQIARTFAQQVSDGYMRLSGLPPRIVRKLLLEYHDISFQDQWLLAGTILDALRRCGAGRDLVSESQARLAMALAGVAGSAKMAGLADPRMLRTAYFKDTIEVSILRALRQGASDV